MGQLGQAEKNSQKLGGNLVTINDAAEYNWGAKNCLVT